MNPSTDPPHPTGPGAAAPRPPTQQREPRTVRQTTCCVVGAGLKPIITTTATIDVLWLRLPRLSGDPEGGGHGDGRHPSSSSSARSRVRAAAATTRRSRSAHRSGPCRWASRATERDLRAIILVRARRAAS
jgi:hypothetical protein